MATITLKGNKIQTVGSIPAVGSEAPFSASSKQTFLKRALLICRQKNGAEHFPES